MENSMFWNMSLVVQSIPEILAKPRKNCNRNDFNCYEFSCQPNITYQKSSKIQVVEHPQTYTINFNYLPPLAEHWKTCISLKLSGLACSKWCRPREAKIIQATFLSIGVLHRELIHRFSQLLGIDFSKQDYSTLCYLAHWIYLHLVFLA